jgi:hypothetical protein
MPYQAVAVNEFFFDCSAHGQAHHLMSNTIQHMQAGANKGTLSKGLLGSGFPEDCLNALPIACASTELAWALLPESIEKKTKIEQDQVYLSGMLPPTGSIKITCVVCVRLTPLAVFSKFIKSTLR